MFNSVLKNLNEEELSLCHKLWFSKPNIFATHVLNLRYFNNLLDQIKDVRQGKWFQKCTHLLYCSVLSLGANVNTRRMSKPDMGSSIHIKNQWNILVIGNYYMNYQNYQNLMLLTSSDTKRTLVHLLLFTNSAQRELVSICTQSIHNRNWLSLPYILGEHKLSMFIYLWLRQGLINQFSILHHLTS